MFGLKQKVQSFSEQNFKHFLTVSDVCVLYLEFV